MPVLRKAADQRDSTSRPWKKGTVPFLTMPRRREAQVIQWDGKRGLSPFDGDGKRGLSPFYAVPLSAVRRRASMPALRKAADQRDSTSRP